MMRGIAFLLPLLGFFLLAPDPAHAQSESKHEQCLVERMPDTVHLDVDERCWVRSQSVKSGTVVVTPRTRGARIECILRIGSKTIWENRPTADCLVELRAKPGWEMRMENIGEVGSDVDVRWRPKRPT